MCVKLSHFAVHVQQRLAQHCKSTILQLKKKSNWVTVMSSPRYKKKN